MRTTSTGLYALSLLVSANYAAGHSWVERLQRIASNGTLLDDHVGFVRRFVARDKPDGTVDFNSQKLLTLGQNGELLCRPETGATIAGAYSDPKYPKLKVAAGDTIAMRYLENGHVTKPQNSPTKPKNQGTVYIYATNQPRDNTKFKDVYHQWTADGQGGDKTGFLLATRNYDDGRCYEDGNPNAEARKKAFDMPDAPSPDGQGTNHWCQNDIKLPANLQPGQDFTLYWLWDYSTINTFGAQDNENFPPGTEYVSREFYISCMDLDVVEDCSDELGSVKGPKCASGGNARAKGIAAAAAPETDAVFNFDSKQDLKLAAIPQQLTMAAFEVPMNGTTASVENAPAAGPTAPVATTTTPDAAPKITEAATSSAAKSPRIKTVFVTEGIATVTVLATAVETTTQTVPKSKATATFARRGEGWFGMH